MLDQMYFDPGMVEPEADESPQEGAESDDGPIPASEVGGGNESLESLARQSDSLKLRRRSFTGRFTGRFAIQSPGALHQLAVLRRPEMVQGLIDRLPAASLIRAVVLELVDSFVMQLGVMVAGATALTLLVHYTMPGMALAGAFQFFYYLTCTLYLCRFPGHYTLGGVFILIATSFTLFSTNLFGGIEPALAFRPTPMFWIVLILVGGMGSVHFNRYLEDLLEMRLLAQQLERDLRQREGQVGRVVKVGREEEQLDLVRQKESEIKKLKNHYSSLFYNFQRLSEDLDGDDLFKAVWEVLQQNLGSTSGEFYRLDGEILEMVLGFQKVDNARHQDGMTYPSEDATGGKSYRVITPDQHPLRSLRLDETETPVFHRAVFNHERVILEEASRDKNVETSRLIARQPGIPVVFCYPLYDARTDKVKGLINISSATQKEFSKEQIQILRTVSGLSGLAFSRWETIAFLKKKQRDTYEKFCRYVSPQVVERIVEDPELVRARRQKITVVFVDLRGFTSLTEAQDVEVVVRILTDFFTYLTPIIFQNLGTLDKYIGDEIMALWGAPVSHEHDSRRALVAAGQMQAAFQKVKTKWEAVIRTPLDIGISINTGESIVGSIGSKEIMNYTAIGDAVNTSARLEGLTGRGKLHITRSTYNEVHDMVEGKWMPPARVQGKAEPLEYFDVLKVHSDRVEDRKAPAPAPAAPGARLADSRDLARKLSKVMSVTTLDEEPDDGGD